MEHFNGFQLLTIITKRSMLDVATVLDPPQTKDANGDICIILTENNKTLLDSRTVANVFNDYFQSIIGKLYLFKWPEEPQFNIFDDINIIIKKFWSHTSINKLKIFQ